MRISGKSGVRSAVKAVLRRLGLEMRRVRRAGPNETVVSLYPDGSPRGRVLLAYVIEPFLLPEGAPISDDHTHDWESFQMARTFLDLGFVVDVISYLNTSFVPTENYNYFVAARTNFDRISARLNKDCVKVVHLDTSHWIFNNHAAYSRLLDLQQRRGQTMINHKMIEANHAIEHADIATVLGNEFTIETYRYAGKPIHRIPISAPCTYDWDDGKDFEGCRNHFLWFGSSGFVHKGLDIVLEAFAGMPGHRLTVCGPFSEERGFIDAFQRELYESPNIDAVGWVNVRNGEFIEIARKCIGLVYPSCSEGGGGSAITCMHAGLIPILSREASVDIGASGVLLGRNSIEAIRKAVLEVSELPLTTLREKARSAWNLARCQHTREAFAACYRKFVNEVLLDGESRKAAQSEIGTSDSA